MSALGATFARAGGAWTIIAGAMNLLSLRRVVRVLPCLLLLGCLVHGPAASAERPNVALPTLGGLQLWSDVAWRDGWRVQRHAWTGHCRLLDADDVRRAWGTERACRAALREHVPTTEPVEHLVILLHGLGRTRHSLGALARTLEAEGLATLQLAWASTQAGLDQHASTLAGLLAELEGVERVSFVTHSMGGLVVRALFALDATEDKRWREHVTVGRIVQIAPPNQGSELARRVLRLPGAGLLGPCLAAVGRGAPDLPGLAPDFAIDFAIVAGVRQDPDGFNPFVRGDDDGIVGLAETRLAGAAESLTVTGLHTFLASDRRVRRFVARFLAHGPL